jgi:hypothetical protein
MVDRFSGRTARVATGLACLWLAACGGGGGDAPAAPTTQPSGLGAPPTGIPSPAPTPITAPGPTAGTAPSSAPAPTVAGAPSTASTPAPVSVGSGGTFARGTARCSDFTFQQDAQAALRAGETQLDGDSDGLACESLPNRPLASTGVPAGPAPAPVAGPVPVVTGSGLGTSLVPRLLFGGPSGDVFLGTITRDPADPNSICNQTGVHGSSFQQLSIWNPFGQYGSTFQQTSSWNSFAQTPPRVVDSNGNFHGFFTVNQFLPNRTTEPDLVAVLNFFSTTGDHSRTRTFACG